MEKFKRKSITKQMIPVTDLGVTVAELLSITEGNKLSKLLLSLLNTEDIKDEFIAIKGAQTLVNNQKIINERFKKEDLKSSISNISLYNGDEFSINFDNASESDYFESLQLEGISTIPIYSATREFFSELYQMDRYASKLIVEGHREILEVNLQMLKQVHNTSKIFRILHDIDDNVLYLRGIISKSYYNYDNNLAVALALLTLHKEMKETGIEYNFRLCEYNESFIRMFFESSEFKELETIGRVKNLIEVSNDEIRREALRFTGVCSIEFGNTDGEQSELFIRSTQEVKSRILSIGHNRIPKTAMEELADIDNARTIHANLFTDIQKITTINNPEQIKHLVRSKVESAKADDIKQFKSRILNELNAVALNIVQLLTMFSKIELLAGEDIDATEYLRFIIYQALIERK